MPRTTRGLASARGDELPPELADPNDPQAAIARRPRRSLKPSAEAQGAPAEGHKQAGLRGCTRRKRAAGARPVAAARAGLDRLLLG